MKPAQIRGQTPAQWSLSSGTDWPTTFPGDFQTDSLPLIVKRCLHIVARRRKGVPACHRRKLGPVVKNPDQNSLAAPSAAVDL